MSCAELPAGASAPAGGCLQLTSLFGTHPVIMIWTKNVASRQLMSKEVRDSRYLAFATAPALVLQHL
jgi:hypothetical protein